MKWYPWLNIPYQQILSRYQQQRGHHAMLLHSQQGTGIASLCYAVSRWLICQQQKGKKSCGVCHSCRLMVAGSHPDFYQLKSVKGRPSLGIDSIRTIINSVYSRARQSNVKVVLLPHAELLTEQATNALLKTLEEPPEDTYFFLVCQTPVRLLPTLRSRCLYWLLPAINEDMALCWLRQVGHEDRLSALSALRLCGGAPLIAEDLLQPVRWQERLAFYTNLHNTLIHGDLLTLLPALNRDKNDRPLHWLLSLLTDALKWKQGLQEFMVNADSMQLVATLAAKWSVDVLHTQWQQWFNYMRQWQEISGVNHELLLTHHLLNWEHGITDTYASSL